MTEKKSFHYYNEALLNMGAVCSASAIDGYFCGKLSGNKAVPATLTESWLEDIQHFMDMTYLSMDASQSALIAELYRHSLGNLGDENFGFRPLLPDDQTSIERRTEELASWCEAYLHGLGNSGLRADDTLSADVADALRDIAKISQAESGEDQQEANLEKAWENLVEYVKVAVLTIKQEMGESLPSVHK